MTGRTPFVVEEGGAPLIDRGRYGAAEVHLVARPGRMNDGLRYGYACIGAVMSGAFHYRSGKGDVEARRGVILCGDEAEEFSFTSKGDGKIRRAVAAFDVEILEETADAVGAPPKFPGSSIICGCSRTRVYGLLRGLTRADGEKEALALQVLALALTARSKRRIEFDGVRAGRIRDVAEHIADTCSEPWTLSEMAALAGMSRYHFIRSFAAVTGETPRQHLINARLRLAVDRLTEADAPVTSIALDVGFNDISHFNHTFRRTFGASPSRWLSRSAAARPAGRTQAPTVQTRFGMRSPRPGQAGF